jgi:cytochrome c-type protein NapB
MRENCAACHAGPAAREEIRTSHPERTRCRQCHVEVTARSEFDSELGEGLVP